MKKISILTPCYNEEGNVYNMYVAIRDVMKTIPQYEYEHLFIDNASTDETQAILYKIACEDKRVKVIFNERNFGPDRSGAYGMYQTTGDASVCLPCDFQEPPELIPQFIKKWEEGYKVVWGKKSESEESKCMYAIRTLYYNIIKKFSDTPQYIHTTGFGIYDKSVVKLLENAKEPRPNFRNLIAEFGYEIGFIEYKQQKRATGKSHYTFGDYLDMAIVSLVNTSRFPIRLAIYVGITLGGVSFVAMIVGVIIQLIIGNTDRIFDSFILGSVFLLSSVQLCFIGLIGEYIYEVLLRSKERPLVIERKRLNFKNIENQQD